MLTRRTLLGSLISALAAWMGSRNESSEAESHSAPRRITARAAPQKEYSEALDDWITAQCRLNFTAEWCKRYLDA